MLGAIRMRMRQGYLRQLLIPLLIFWPLAPNAWAEDAASFPSRGISIVVPFAPGGAADILARTVAQFTGAETGWQLHIENITGAGGLVGAQAAARSAPDGYTLLLCNIACAANQFMLADSNWNPKSAIAPVITLGYLPNVLVVGPSVQGNTLKDFIDRARAQPERVSIATSGPGSSSSLTAELLAAKAGIQITEIPYRGSSAATPDLISGRVDAMVMGLPEIVALGSRRQSEGPWGHIDRPSAIPAGRADHRGGGSPRIPVPRLALLVLTEGHARRDRRQAQCRIQQGARVGRSPKTIFRVEYSVRWRSSRFGRTPAERRHRALGADLKKTRRHEPLIPYADRPWQNYKQRLAAGH